jgi:hypothetical protein
MSKAKITQEIENTIQKIRDDLDKLQRKDTKEYVVMEHHYDFVSSSAARDPSKLAATPGADGIVKFVGVKQSIYFSDVARAVRDLIEKRIDSEFAECARKGFSIPKPNISRGPVSEGDAVRNEAEDAGVDQGLLDQLECDDGERSEIAITFGNMWDNVLGWFQSEKGFDGEQKMLEEQKKEEARVAHIVDSVPAKVTLDAVYTLACKTLPKKYCRKGAGCKFEDNFCQLVKLAGANYAYYKLVENAWANRSLTDWVPMLLYIAAQAKNLERHVADSLAICDKFRSVYGPLIQKREAAKQILWELEKQPCVDGSNEAPATTPAAETATFMQASANSGDILSWVRNDDGGGDSFEQTTIMSWLGRS